MKNGGEGGLGWVFLFGEKRDGIRIEVIEGPVTLALAFGDDIEKASSEAYPSISHLDVACGTDRCLFAVDSSQGPVRAVVSGLPDEGIEFESLLGAAESTAIENGRFELRFGALEAKGLQFKRGPGAE